MVDVSVTAELLPLSSPSRVTQQDSVCAGEGAELKRRNRRTRCVLSLECYPDTAVVS